MAAPLDRVKALLAALPRDDQEELTRFLHDMLVTPEEVEARERPVATLQARQAGKTVTYTFRNEWIRCGKPACKCANGAFHGPYTYKYWREDGRVKKSYVGKPAATRAERAAPTAAAPPPRRPGGRSPEGRARAGNGQSSGGPTSRPSPGR